MGEIDKLVFTSSHVQIAGKYTPDKLTDHSARGVMKTFSLPNIKIQIIHLQNTYMILDTHLAP